MTAATTSMVDRGIAFNRHTVRTLAEETLIKALYRNRHRGDLVANNDCSASFEKDMLPSFAEAIDQLRGVTA